MGGPMPARRRSCCREADALAARGDYDEAVHLLLRRSVADIAGRLPDFLRPSLTARDIASAASVPTRARNAFSRDRAHRRGRPVRAPAGRRRGLAAGARRL